MTRVTYPLGATSKHLPSVVFWDVRPYTDHGPPLIPFLFYGCLWSTVEPPPTRPGLRLS